MVYDIIRRSTTWMGAFVLLSTLGLLFLAPSPVYSQAQSVPGYVKNVNHWASLRAAPMARSGRLHKVPKGAAIEVLAQGIPSRDSGRLKGRFPRWSKVRYRGKVGYIASNFVGLQAKPVAPVKPKPVKPTGNVIRLRYDKTKSYQDMAKSLFADKQLLLTFDDGPRIGVTGEILDLLKKYNAQGVFFVNGYAIRMARKKGGTKLIERMYREGHIVANHTDRHRNLSKITLAERRKEIEDCDVEIHKEFQSFGETWIPSLFRFPSGAYNHKSGADLRKEVHSRYKLMVCGPTKIHGSDWYKSANANTILQKLKLTTNYHKKGIVVLHEKDPSVEALRDFLAWAVQNGYTFVRLDVPGVQVTPSPGGVAGGAPKGIPTVNVDRHLKRTRYHNLYYKWGKHYGVDWRLLKAFSIVESSEKAHVVNRFGYTGLFQIGKSALKSFNRSQKMNWTMADMKNAAKNTRVGAWLTASNTRNLSRPSAFGPTFLTKPLNHAVALYCAHNYGVGLTKRTVQAHRSAGKPMTFNPVFDAIESAGRARYGIVPGSRKMEVAKKVGALYLGLRGKLGTRP